MKKVLVILALSLFAMRAFAQTEKGKWRIGGDANLGFLNTKFDGANDSRNNFDIGVDAGYFVIDNLSINAGVGFSYDKFGDDDADNMFDFSIGARYYLPMKVFFGAEFDVYNVKSGGADGVTGTGIGLMAGYAWFLNDKIALEPAVGYRIGLSSKDDHTKFNAFGIQIGFGIYF